MKRKIIFALLIVLLVAGALVGVRVLQIRKLIAMGKTMVPPPETVSTTVVREETWPRMITAIGSITAVQGVMLSPEIAGTVREIAFASGAQATQGDVLVRLDTSSEEAQLRAIAAQAELAQINLDRMRRLRTDDTVSQAELDTAEKSLKQMQAEADAIRAAIDKKTIRAPFAGQLGIRQVNLGQYLKAGDPIVSLQSLDSVYADFSLPQQNLAQLQTGMQVHLTTDAYPGQTFKGQLAAINPDLNRSTRSVSLRATFNNADHRLRPGMFARIKVLLAATETVLAIPSTAILSAPYGDSVYVVTAQPGAAGGKPGLTVRQQFVQLGRTHGDFVAVTTGLKAGDRIVSAGLFKLRNGMAVTENNSLAPKPATAPKPAEG